MTLNRRYVPDLKKLSAACEGNYMRLKKLLPNFELGYEKTFSIQSNQHQGKVTLEVVESFPYTSTVKVVQQSASSFWLQPPSMHVRLYHDARSAEVTSYQNQKRIEGKYQYPNTQMRMPDEKTQLNQFLAEWLTHCLKYGHAEFELDFLPLR